MTFNHCCMSYIILLFHRCTNNSAVSIFSPFFFFLQVGDRAGQGHDDDWALHEYCTEFEPFLYTQTLRLCTDKCILQHYRVYIWDCNKFIMISSFSVWQSESDSVKAYDSYSFGLEGRGNGNDSGHIFEGQRICSPFPSPMSPYHLEFSGHSNLRKRVLISRQYWGSRFTRRCSHD